MQAAKTRSHVSTESPSVRLLAELFYTFLGFVAIAILLAGASFPRRISSGSLRTGSAIVQPAHAAGAVVARSLPAPQVLIR